MSVAGHGHREVARQVLEIELPLCEWSLRRAPGQERRLGTRDVPLAYVALFGERRECDLAQPVDIVDRYRPVGLRHDGVFLQTP
jgi:hypothetical protein